MGSDRTVREGTEADLVERRFGGRSIPVAGPLERAEIGRASVTVRRMACATT